LTVLSQTTPVEIRPQNKTVPNEGTAKVDILVPDADAGVGSYEFNISVADTSVATIEDVSIVGADQTDTLATIDIGENGAYASVAVGAGDADETRIATIQLQGHTISSTTLMIESANIGDDSGMSYQISSLGDATVQVQAPPEPVVNGGDSSNAPTDTDGDGTFEDVNGDNKFDIVDVNAIFQNQEASSVAEYPEYFDYNNDGQFTIVDVNALLQMAAES
jgi:PKD repeat protein